MQQAPDGEAARSTLEQCCSVVLLPGSTTPQHAPLLPARPPCPPCARQQAAVSLALSLPWSAWSTFVLEARHGFNKTSPTTFVTDTLKGVSWLCSVCPSLREGLLLLMACALRSLVWAAVAAPACSRSFVPPLHTAAPPLPAQVALGLVFLPPLVAAFTAILQRSSPHIGLYLWAFLLAVQLFVLTIYPTVCVGGVGGDAGAAGGSRHPAPASQSHRPALARACFLGGCIVRVRCCYGATSDACPGRSHACR